MLFVFNVHTHGGGVLTATIRSTWQGENDVIFGSFQDLYPYSDRIYAPCALCYACSVKL